MSTNVVRVRHPSVLGIVSVALVFALTATLLAWSPAPAGAVAGYGDVPRDRYFTNPVQWAVDAGIAEPGACFEPGAAATRGDTAAYLWRMQGEPTPTAAHRFVDVTAGWQQDPVSWLYATGITTGTSPTTFGPGETLNRGQFAAFLWRLAGEPTPTTAHRFVDVTAGWQQDPVSWLYATGITTGTSPTTFAPNEHEPRSTRYVPVPLQQQPDGHRQPLHTALRSIGHRRTCNDADRRSRILLRSPKCGIYRC